MTCYTRPVNPGLLNLYALAVGFSTLRAAQGLQGFFFFFLAAQGLHGLQGLQAALTAQGLHALAAQGLQALAAHGLQGLHTLAAHGLHALAAHGLHALAAQGLHGLHGFNTFAAQGLQGLHGLQGLTATVVEEEGNEGAVVQPAATSAPAPAASIIPVNTDLLSLFLLNLLGRDILTLLIS